MDLKDLDEKLLTLAEASRLLPNKPSPVTLWRWRSKGVHGVRLKCVRVGRSWYVTRSALLEFLRQQTEAANKSDSSAPLGSAASNRSEALTRRLREAGCLAPSVVGRPAKRGRGRS